MTEETKTAKAATIQGEEFNRLREVHKGVLALVEEANGEFQALENKWNDRINAAKKEFFDDMLRTVGWVEGTPVSINQDHEELGMYIVRHTPPQPANPGTPHGLVNLADLPPGVAAMLGAAAGAGAQVIATEGETIKADTTAAA